jgi:hypothetical protein
LEWGSWTSYQIVRSRSRGLALDLVLKLLRQEYRPQGKERWLSPLTTGTLPNALRRLTSTTARPLSWATPGESANGWKSISGWLIREHQTAETDTLWSSYDTIKHVRVVPRTLLPAARRDGGDKVKAGTNSHLSEVNHFCMHRMYVTLSRMSCYARLVSVLRDPSRIATTFWLPLLLRCAGSTNIIPKRPVLSWSRCCAIGAPMLLPLSLGPVLCFRCTICPHRSVA